MRSLDECKAEIFVRSEKRIKEKKKQRLRIIFCSISFCIVATVCSAILFPALNPKTDSFSDGTDGNKGDSGIFMDSFKGEVSKGETQSTATGEKYDGFYDTEPNYGEVEYIQIYRDYPVYKTASEIVNNSSKIYIGTVKNISFEIIDMNTGKVDEDYNSKSNLRMLYTVYTISVKNSLKGDKFEEVKIYRMGGLRDYKINEQYGKIKESGLFEKYQGIPLLYCNNYISPVLEREYLFCTNEWDYAINPTQFACEINSRIAEKIIEILK